MCDGKAADMLAGRYGGYGPGMKRMCRSCVCPFEKCDDPYFQCIPIDPVKIQSAVDDIAAAESFLNTLDP